MISYPSSRSALLLGLTICLLLATGTACQKSKLNAWDEKQDPNYKAGVDRVKGRNYEGAAESFRLALRTNPQSASAHYELGLLNYEQLQNYPAAIYHFEEFQRLNPSDQRGQALKSQIVPACKQELARSVLLDPLTKQTQLDMANLIEKNDQLKKENQQLKERNQFLEKELRGRIVNDIAQRGSPSSNSSTPLEPTKNMKYHEVQPGESPYSIAKQHQISVPELLQANPGLEPTKMQIGQKLAIPIIP